MVSQSTISNEKSVCERLKKKREEMKLTVGEMYFYLVKNGLEITPSTYYSWESGRRAPSFKHIQGLSRAINVPAQYFFE